MKITYITALLVGVTVALPTPGNGWSNGGSGWGGSGGQVGGNSGGQAGGNGGGQQGGNNGGQSAPPVRDQRIASIYSNSLLTIIL